MTTLAALVARRLTHELAGPIGAIATGVELLGGDDGDVRALLADGAASLIASLRLHRFVLDPPGSADTAATAQGLLAAWAATRDGVTLDWTITGPLDGAQAAVLLGLAMSAVEAAPRGGILCVRDDAVTLTADYIVLDRDVAAALAGAPPLASRAALAGLIHAAAFAGGRVLAVEDARGILHLKVHQGSALPR